MYTLGFGRLERLSPLLAVALGFDSWLMSEYQVYTISYTTRSSSSVAESAKSRVGKTKQTNLDIDNQWAC